jgi:hypothetical protein
MRLSRRTEPFDCDQHIFELKLMDSARIEAGRVMVAPESEEFANL